jgi:DNA-binding HxlR family transcriptional regulator
MGRRHPAPAALTAHHDCEFREVLDRVGDKWSLLVIAMLEQTPAQRARFSALKRVVPGISQRMLTATLRNLERDGLLTRDVYAEVPPRVEYELTPLGRMFMQPVRGLVTWLQANWASIRAARETFDRRSHSRNAAPTPSAARRERPPTSRTANGVRESPP